MRGRRGPAGAGGLELQLLQGSGFGGPVPAGCWLAAGPDACVEVLFRAGTIPGSRTRGRSCFLRGLFVLRSSGQGMCH